MQNINKIVECMYCKERGIVSKHCRSDNYKCPDCHRIWHNIRVKKGVNKCEIHNLVRWYISQKLECRECKSTKNITIDRIKSEKMGGRYEISNMQLLCYTCNCCKKGRSRSVREALKIPTKKECGDCHRTKPLNSKYWHRTSFKPKYGTIMKSSFCTYCKPCKIKRERAYKP